MKDIIMITGASGGIGREMALVAAGDGHHVLLVARNEERLKALCNDINTKYRVTADYIAINLAEAGAAQNLYREVTNRGYHVNYLVNNAGFGDYGDFVKGDLAKFRQMIQLNIITLTELTWLFVRDMIKVKKGGVLNIASTAAMQPDPYMAVYGATKTYVANFTEAISYELRHTGVSATVLSPGATDTAFFEVAQMSGSDLANNSMSAETVAKVGYHAMIAGKLHVIPGFKNRVLGFLSGVMPPMKLKLAVAAYMLRKK